MKKRWPFHCRTAETPWPNFEHLCLECRAFPRQERPRPAKDSISPCCFCSTAIPIRLSPSSPADPTQSRHPRSLPEVAVTAVINRSQFLASVRQFSALGIRRTASSLLVNRSQLLRSAPLQPGSYWRTKYASINRNQFLAPSTALPNFPARSKTSALLCLFSTLSHAAGPSSLATSDQPHFAISSFALLRRHESTSAFLQAIGENLTFSHCFGSQTPHRGGGGISIPGSASMC
jgi:hypothetical protein